MRLNSELHVLYLELFKSSDRCHDIGNAKDILLSVAQCLSYSVTVIPVVFFNCGLCRKIYFWYTGIDMLIYKVYVLVKYELYVTVE